MSNTWAPNTRTLTPSLVNEARFGYSRFFNSTGTYSAFNVDTVAALGVPSLKSGDPVTWGVPAISLNGDGFSGIGDNTDGPYANNNSTLQLVDNLSWVKGSTRSASVSSITASTTIKLAISSRAATSSSSRM